MGVLEPRENAEKVGYPVVGEDIKEADNVIDYNIREEITIDASGVINANNDTTTGMATVIPGVNAPKLIASTSIYNNTPNKTAYAKSYGEVTITIDQGETLTGLLRPVTIQDQGGAYTYSVGDYFNGYINVTDACIILPSSGVYQIECTYYSKVNVFGRSYNVFVNLNQVYHLQNDNYYSQTGSAYPTETFYINANKGDQFAIYYEATCEGGGLGNVMKLDATFKITKVS